MSSQKALISPYHYCENINRKEKFLKPCGIDRNGQIRNQYKSLSMNLFCIPVNVLYIIIKKLITLNVLVLYNKAILKIKNNNLFYVILLFLKMNQIENKENKCDNLNYGLSSIE